jgi:gamma-glutamyltranspeptidase/glutathione hydrolase
VALTLGLTSCSLLPPRAAPEPAPIDSVPRAAAASTAHPLATRAALRLLAAGGSATDASIAAQLVLGLVEPQSSGLGGGTLLLVWDAGERRLRSYDGLAAAPARTTASLRTDIDGRLLPLDQVARSGRSVGVPGVLAVLEQAHRRHGRLPWARLFDPAIELAEQGFAIAPYVHGILARDPGARDHAEWRADWFDATGRVHPVGTLLRNPAYADTLRRLARLGVDGFWRDGGAERLVAATQRGPHPGLMTVDDVRGYRAVEREPLCAPVRVWTICTAGPPSFGGIALLQMLQLLDLRAGDAITPAALDDPGFWHLYAEAGRLAQADRRHWVGDPDHARVPAAALVDAAYLRRRAATIDPDRAAPPVRHGNPAAADHTSQVVVADAQGQVVSTTTTINLNFGARLRVDGYVLNNALTNFGPAPERGQATPNQMAPGKRPVTSMAPVIVFDDQGRVLVAGGSAGGGPIVDYVARNLLELLWLGRTPAQALAGGQVTTALAPRVQLEAGTPRAALADALRARGHEVTVDPLPSGAGFLRRVDGGWLGAADPRRDGVALGL